MKQFVVIAAAALALSACGPRETESGGEVVDTLNTPNLDVDLRTDTLTPTIGTEPDTLIIKKPVVTGRKPVDMKDSLRRP